MDFTHQLVSTKIWQFTKRGSKTEYTAIKIWFKIQIANLCNGAFFLAEGTVDLKVNHVTDICFMVNHLVNISCHRELACENKMLIYVLQKDSF